jgi:translocation and assembly module TamB
MRRVLVLSTTLLVAALVGGTAWLASSASGLQQLARLAGSASGGRLQIDQPSGRLLGPLEIATLRWQTPELQVQAERIHVDWRPATLLRGSLAIAELRIEQLHIVSAPSEPPTPPPTDLRLPLAVDIDHVQIAALHYGNLLTASDVAGRLSSDGRHHRLSDFRARAADIAVSGQATLDGAPPLLLAAGAELTGQLAEQPLALAVQAAGRLERLALQAVARQGLEGEAEMVLTPFAPAAFASARIALANLDPAAWHRAAPKARLSLRADLAPQGDGVAGEFTLSNPQHGPLDRQRLPLASLTGRLDWQGASARLDKLQAKLSGPGELSGHGEWENGALALDLAAQNLDAAQIVSTLRPTRLAGPITASLAANRQTIKLDLKDPKFTLRAAASHAGEKITVDRLEIGAGDARLAASGDLTMNDKLTFAARGELSHFDPSRFAKVPAARINAQLTAQGQLAPRPVVTASFALTDSQLAKQPLTGHGKLSIDWPRIPQADIALAAGANTLQARGAFGRPGDTLSIAIEANQLAPYGLEGGISGRLALSGTVQQPKLAARAEAGQLGHPDFGRLNGLTLTAEAGGQPDSPLLIDLAIAQLATPTQPALAKLLRVDGEGSNRAHRLRASGELAGQLAFSATAEGGLNFGPNSPTWRGRLLEAGLRGPEPARNVRLTAPAALEVGADQWSFGPAQLAGDPLDWRATLQAAADPRQLRASLSARGSRVGQIDGQLSAGMQGAWALNQQAPWQGSLKSDIADLGWLAELIGDEWQSAGRFFGELKLSGSPAQPQANGRFRGEKLALRRPDQGLNLARGELVIDLDNNLLRVRRLSFDSLLQNMPRPLRQASREAVTKLTEQPGRLEISGETQIDRSKGADNGFLDFHLDRLGAWQLPDQWVAVSGDGRLTWQGDTFGAKGKLAVDAGYWQLAPSGAPRLSSDVIVKRPGDAKPAAMLRPKLDLDISTDLGRNFYFNGVGLATRLAGNIRLQAAGRDLPRASGTIRARDGRFDAYGQQLAIDRGILTFQGLLDNPALDVRAMRKGLSVEAGVQIAGTVQRPIVKLVSDPELPDAEKLAWLVLGHGPDQMSAGDATVLLSAASGLLGNNSGNLVQQLKTTFGIDELGVRQGDIGSTGSRQLSSRVAGSTVDTAATTGNQILSVGKRLSANALLSYEQSLGRAESIVKLTVNLTRQISLIGRAGSDNALDIFYTLTFGRGKNERTPASARPETGDSR